MQNAEAAWQGFLARLRPGRPQASAFGGGVRKGSRARPAQSHCGPVAQGLMASGFRGRAMVRVAQSHLETKSLGPLSQLYFNEQLAFTEAQAAGEEYPNTDTLAFFDFTAQQEDESEVQTVQTLQADVVTCLCAPYECAGQVGARSGQGGVKPVLAQGRAEEMPAVLGKWGCDAELWSKIHNKQKLLKYASEGQEDKARRFIERVRNSVANAQAAAAPAAAAASDRRRLAGDAPAAGRVGVRRRAVARHPVQK